MDSNLYGNLSQQAEDGDQMASMIQRDMAEEAGFAVNDDVQVGEKVFVMTSSHYFFGEVVGLNHEWVVLGKGAWVVFSSGKIADFVNNGKPTYAEQIPNRALGCRIRRGSIVSVWPLPHDYAVNYQGSDDN